MGALKNHPGKWMRDDAAEQFNKFEDDHGIITVNSAGRTEDEQDDLIHRYFVVGGKYNRPPYLFAPARPAKASNHVSNGGIAVDVADIEHMHKYGEDYGFYHPHHWDAPHFEFDPNRVKIKATNEEEEEEMFVNIQGKAGVRRGGLHYIADGKATFLGGSAKGVPSLDFAQGSALAKRVSGIGG